MSGNEEEKWMVIPVNAEYHETAIESNVDVRISTSEELAALIIFLFLFAITATAVIVYVSKLTDNYRRAKEEEKHNSKGKEHANALSSRGWSIEETGCWDTESCSDSSDDEGVKNVVSRPLPGSGRPPIKPEHLQTCHICATDFEEGVAILHSNNPTCGHIFHQECIEKWLNYQYSCPICNELFVFKQVD